MVFFALLLVANNGVGSSVWYSACGDIASKSSAPTLGVTAIVTFLRTVLIMERQSSGGWVKSKEGLRVSKSHWPQAPGQCCNGPRDPAEGTEIRHLE